MRDGGIPRELVSALPNGIDPDRRARINEALSRLDELTATTIHGFCQGLVRAYAMKVRVDPGFIVMDDPGPALGTIRGLAELRRRHPVARPARWPSSRPELAFSLGGDTPA